MGDKKVEAGYNEELMRDYTRGVLNDLQALDEMLAAGMLEESALRIGAEQEMFLIDRSMNPAPLAMDVIEIARDGRLTTEIGRFNLEANLTPLDLGGDCFSRMENELYEVMDNVRAAAGKIGGDAVLAGILPTIRPSDVTLDNLTPLPRYAEIDRVVTLLNGRDRELLIKGLDELHLTLENTFTEFCNTSFQVHLQTGISDFVNVYNWAQAMSAPVLASAVNSPVFFGHRLWHETRIALFQQAADTRSHTHKQRNQTPRVNFGDRWVDNSIIEVLREDAIRFRVLLTKQIDEDAMAVLASGGVPKLSAWQLHNGTIWRWNRPCYGVINGRPGLRIEARYLPAGPSIIDEMANSAFLVGLLLQMPAEFGDIRTYMSFDEAKSNFFNAARYGLNGQIRGLDGKSRRVGRIILEELLPRAKQGLTMAGVDNKDVDRLLNVIEERVAAETSGARWMLDSYAGMDPLAKPNVRLRTLVASMKENQETRLPVHEWPLAHVPQKPEWIDSYQTVQQFMAVDLFTVRPEDIVDLAANLMSWRKVRHVPVENDAGELIGIVSHRDLIKLLAEGKTGRSAPIAIREVMKIELITVTPDTPTLDALQLMRDHKIGCLPVVCGKKLVGLLTAHDFLTVSAKLFEEALRSMNATTEEKNGKGQPAAKADSGSVF
jgi:CBS domain-containing protein